MRSARFIAIVALVCALFGSAAPASAVSKHLVFFLVRHGQSEDNAAGVQSGWSPAALTSRGQSQATALGVALAGLNLKAVYVSDLPRAIETESLMHAAFRATVTASQDARFREWGVGSFDRQPGSVIAAAEARVLTTTVAKVYLMPDAKRMDALAKADPTHATETYAVFKKRILAGINSAVSANSSGVVMIVAHGYVIKHLLGNLVPTKYAGQGIANCSVTVLDYLNGVWTLKQLPTTTPKLPNSYLLPVG